MIDGRPMPAHHYRRERTNSGNQDGTEWGPVWSSADASMPLPTRHQISTKTNP